MGRRADPAPPGNPLKIRAGMAAQTALVLSDDADCVALVAPSCRSLLWLQPGRARGVQTRPPVHRGLRVQRMSPPQSWPAGQFDLIVLDDQIRALGNHDLSRVAALCVSSLRLHGMVMVRLSTTACDEADRRRVQLSLGSGWPLLRVIESCRGDRQVTGWSRECALVGVRAGERSAPAPRPGTR